MKNKLNFTIMVLAIAISASFNANAQGKEPLIRNWIIPERATDTDIRLIDLTKYYTAALDDDWLVSAGANLKRLPKGVQEFGGVKFDIRGIIQLGGMRLYEESDYPKKEQKVKYPEKVNDIKVNQKASKICFLQASAWGTDKNKEVGKYIIHYEDGTFATIPLKYMDALRDWFIEDEKMPENATQAWTGKNDLTEKKGFPIALFNFKWTNPHKNKTIKSIDFVSTLTPVAPYLVAISLVD